MDREILFHGKRLDNGEWVEGYLWSQRTIGHTSPCGNIDEIVVDPSTVGQYTGLTDRNRKKIFEGDIIKQTNFYDQLKIQGPVVYGKAAQYIVRHTYTEQENPYKKGKTKAFAVSPRCEVIGNIHDNPELMGGEGDEIT